MSANTASADYCRQIEALRPALLKYARLQLRNPAWADDAVSDTLLAALEKPQAFAGQSQLKTWLIGILKHKLVDQIRRNSRELSTKVFAAQCRLIEKGFRQGGTASYGLRRLLLDQNGQSKG
ncbi:hypothetical protein E8M68_14020, partial [Neisseria gonorrhoeae]|uniref:sigma factor n=1 Tax=Neisseria gonorrhoeae TaxID=485 RepID=UPI00113A6D6E